jgi:DNA adenine methylase
MERDMSKPFLKWAGGKQRLLPQILKHFPERIEGTYYEPFLGSGAVFFALKERQPDLKAILSDRNEELVNCYIQVRDYIDELIERISILADVHYWYIDLKRDPRKWFLSMRDIKPEELDDIGNAARFIYLNKTCFNGLYRVNGKGEFNVSMGKYDNPIICDESTLKACSEALQGIEIRHADFSEQIQLAQPGDVLYVDPPYIGGFVGYTSEKWNEWDLCVLKSHLDEAQSRNVQIFMSNADHRDVRYLFKSWDITTVKRSGAISCDPNKRQSIAEVLIHSPMDLPCTVSV